ncbi:DUF424 domain-containing protein [Candidatus Bathyarchaeota archaeon]|nr:MAG: DUF424 domain-containing protein [Candidatus Bathyarchaeota archaeon]
MRDKGEFHPSIPCVSVYVNIWRWPRCVMVSVCDEELLGKVLREGDLVFEVNEKFYKGSRMTVEEALVHLRNCNIANLVGEKIVEAAIKEKIVHPEAVIRIAGIPHAQIVRM